MNRSRLRSRVNTSRHLSSYANLEKTTVIALAYHSNQSIKVKYLQTINYLAGLGTSDISSTPNESVCVAAVGIADWGSS
jgi:hypothetical protein